ncbi:MAG: hypothetical protein FWC42_06035 [Proteobacteria bacterium]|nr:hypothetical protein [Pseudomonadota bacterium]
MKENWKNISDISAKYGMEYVGLGGDVWPHEWDGDNLHLSSLLERMQAYTETEYNGATIHVHAPVELKLVMDYFNSPRVATKKPILIEIQLAHDGFNVGADGFDFGNPEGGYSIIETEIILKDSKEAINTYLNKSGLFKSMALMRDFISSLEGAARRGECEDWDGYVPLAIKKLAGGASSSKLADSAP